MNKRRMGCLWIAVVLIVVQVLGILPDSRGLVRISASSTTETMEHEKVPEDKEEVMDNAVVLPDPSEEPEQSIVFNEENSEQGIPTEEPIATEDVVVQIEPTTAPAIIQNANIRMAFTTDLHGQLDTTDYETGGAVSTGSYARAVTAIEEVRAEAGKENTFLFDLGDALYDYTTDYIYSQDEDAVQPIYQAISSMGYDAITLGNHEFDYTLEYINKQINSSGLKGICVVSNVMNANTGKNVWKETMMIERNIVAEDGTTAVVKVGVIGETVPTLSKKRTDYTGILKTEDIVQNTEKKAQYLKQQGADIVVVLSHSGMGEENPGENAQNASYALTKIDEVDVVLCGHEHRFFPSSSESSEEYYKLSGVDKETGLVNGKTLIMVGAYGTGVGVADLNLKISDGKVEIVNRTSSIRNITSKTAVNEKISNAYWGKWKTILTSSYSTILAEIASDERWENYFGEVEDTAIIQFMNNINTGYALKYINTTMTEHKNQPIVAVSSYLKYGNSGSEDYIDISGNFIQSYMTYFRKYKTGLYLYEVTGKQLKEWIEWGASGYTTAEEADVTNELTDIDLQKSITQSGEKKLHFLMQKDWRINWANMFIFDGVEYNIDISQKPRYSMEGNLINNSNRITKLTINGQNVSDEQKFIVVGIRIDESGTLAKELANTKIYSSSTEKYRDWISEYIVNNGMNGSLRQMTDYNWQIIAPTNYDYVIKTGKNAGAVAEKKEWITQEIQKGNEYLFYKVDFSKKSTEDKTGPNLVVSKLSDVETNKNVKVKVHATDGSGIRSLKYTLGRFTKDAVVWDSASSVENYTIQCKDNGVYSVLAEDMHGNKRVCCFRINNINHSVLEAPKVNTFSNRMKTISGTAEAKANVFFELENGKIYKTKATSKGDFSYTLPIQKADQNIYVYVVDSNGRASARTVVTVKRTGPNKIIANTVNSNSYKLTGTVNDNYVTVVALVNDTTIYVPENGGKEIYRNSQLYDEEYNVKTVKETISGGKFTMKLNRLLPADATVKFYNIDTLGRKSSAASKTVVQQVPNRPQVEAGKIYNYQSKIKVSADEKCKVVLKIDGKLYATRKCEFKSEDNRYHYVVTIPRTNSGVRVQLYAENAKGKSSSISYVKKEYVPNTPKLTQVKLKSKIIRGTVHLLYSGSGKATVKKSGTKVYAIIRGKKYKAVVHDNGTFRIKTKKLKKGTRITIWAENSRGVGRKGIKIIR